MKISFVISENYTVNTLIDVAIFTTQIRTMAIVWQCSLICTIRITHN